jgi:hypothetical protein
MMLSTGQKRDINGLKQGIIDVSGYERALTIAATVKEYSELVSFAYTREFILGVMACLNTPEYSHEHMQAKLEYQSRSLRRCVNVKQYKEQFAEIYNHALSAKNHITIK